MPSKRTVIITLSIGLFLAIFVYPTIRPYLFSLGMMKTLSTSDLAYYAYVKDQSGNPVQDAEVKMEMTRHNTFTLGTNNKFYYTKTDKDGYFKFAPREGMGFGITVSKAGYDNGYGDYGRSILDDPRNPNMPSPENPKNIVMWKQNPAKKLIKREQISQEFRYKEDFNFVCYFNIREGKQVQEIGDNVIKMSGKVDFSTEREHTIEDFKLETQDGVCGIQVATDKFFKIAPLESYSNSVAVENTNNDNYAGSKFYFKSSKSQIYGFFNAGATAYGNYETPVLKLTLSYIRINPDGTPNLEENKGY